MISSGILHQYCMYTCDVTLFCIGTPSSGERFIQWLHTLAWRSYCRTETCSNMCTHFIRLTLMVIWANVAWRNNGIMMFQLGCTEVMGPVAASINKDMNLRVPQRLKNLLTVWTNILFLTRTRVHWIRIWFYSLYDLRMYVFRPNTTDVPLQLHAHSVASSVLSSLFHYRYSELFRLTWVYEVLMLNASSYSSTLPTPLHNYTGKPFFFLFVVGVLHDTMNRHLFPAWNLRFSR
jgi:hypothetical protein